MAVHRWLARLGFRRGDPTKGANRRLTALAAAVASQHESVEQETRAFAQEQSVGIDSVLAHVENLRLGELGQQTRALHASLRRQVRDGKAMQEQQRAARQPRDSTVVVEQLAAIGKAQQPILAGPWLRDAGLELLYWVPFLRWFTQTFHVAPERLHVVSRGGAPWYGDLTTCYTDVLSLGPELVEQGGAEPPVADPIVATVADRVFPGGESPLVLSPQLMDALFIGYWNHESPFRSVARHLTARRLPPPTMSLPSLPSRFVAARFAFSESFPETPSNRAFLDELLATITRSHDVVWLGAGIAGADGEQQTCYAPATGSRIHHFEHLVPRHHVLAAQAAVIARASVFVGTYGGLSYIAPFYDVPAVAFYAVRNFFPHYRRVADHVFGTNSRCLNVINAADETVLRAAFSGAAPDLLRTGS